jgi:sulfur-carrier protein adenylyltransferase/sulfurtransferase
MSLRSTHDQGEVESNLASMSFPPLVEPAASLSAREVERYARHVLIPDLGMEGQRRLKNARVLVVGAGGLGSPALMYLAAAGVGTIGVVDADVVELSNLQRQVVHGVADIGRMKSESAAETLESVNPLVRVVRHDVRIDSGNALDIIAGYDLVLDGTDNFPTRYLLNDACVLLGKPHVWGSIYRFDGQTSIWWARHGPCYRCVFPEPPPPGLVPSCAEGGVLGVLCAAIGSIQAAEAVKLIVGLGDPLIGRLLVHDGLRQSWDTLTVRKDPDCAVCGESPTVTELVDYLDFCEGAPPAGGGTPGGSVTAPAGGAVPLISARELAEQLSGSSSAGPSPGVLLVDVRGREERAIASIPGARAIHLDEFRSGAAVLQIPFDQPVVIHCKVGTRSEEAARILIEAGHPNVRNLAGGVLAWVRDVDPAQPSY